MYLRWLLFVILTICLVNGCDIGIDEQLVIALARHGHIVSATARRVDFIQHLAKKRANIVALGLSSVT
jgi:1-acylglycerone phosphate reductase